MGLMSEPTLRHGAQAAVPRHARLGDHPTPRYCLRVNSAAVYDRNLEA